MPAVIVKTNNDLKKYLSISAHDLKVYYSTEQLIDIIKESQKRFLELERLYRQSIETKLGF